MKHLKMISIHWCTNNTFSFQMIDTSKVVADLAQIMSIDLQRSKNFGRITVRDMSSCIEKISTVDPQVHAELLEAFDCHYVSNISNDSCLNIYIEEAGQFSAEISDMLFKKAITIFSDKQSDSTFTKLWDVGKALFGYETSSKAQNMARFFSHCIQDVKLENDLNPIRAFESLAGLPALSGMMKFFPNLLKRKLLQDEVIVKSQHILETVDQFSIYLSQGQLMLQDFTLLRNEAIINRFISLHECLAEVRNSEQVVRNNGLRDLIKLRLEEVDSFYKAREDVNKFVVKFDNFKIENVMSQFDRNCAQLKDVCKVRTTEGAIELLLDGISPSDMDQVRRHNRYYENSAIFREINDDVLSDEEEVELRLESHAHLTCFFP